MGGRPAQRGQSWGVGGGGFQLFPDLFSEALRRFSCNPAQATAVRPRPPSGTGQGGAHSPTRAETGRWSSEAERWAWWPGQKRTCQTRHRILCDQMLRCRLWGQPCGVLKEPGEAPAATSPRAERLRSTHGLQVWVQVRERGRYCCRIIMRGLPWWPSGKELTCQCRRCRFDPWVRKIPWRRKWQPAPVFLPGESLGQRSLVGYSPRGHKE